MKRARRAGQVGGGGLPVVLAFAAGLGSGLVLALSPVAFATDIDATYKKLRVLSQVLAYVQENYVDEISEEELIYDSITGMLKDLDPHTTFMRPAEYQKLREDTAGEFGGLGVELLDDGAGIRVAGVHPDGAAERAGLRRWDRIVGIDGEDIAELTLEDIVKRLRGLPGTKVVLRVMRKGWDTPREIPLIRRHVRVVSVEHAVLKDNVGYVRISSFQERTDQELAQALADLRRQMTKAGHAELGGLILDLRDNPGGLLEEGVKVADRFLEEGVIVSTAGRNPRNVEKQMAHDRGTEAGYPLVVLVNGGTASASEIVAGALQDHKRAVVIGTRSFGKSSVQTLFGLDDGSGLKLTIARYFTPSGRSIQDTGIVPDLVMASEGGDEPLAPMEEGPEQRLASDNQLRGAFDVITHWPERRAAAGRRR